jgi:hypothetical protein
MSIESTQGHSCGEQEVSSALDRSLDKPDAQTTVVEVGAILRSLATHHDHGAGWVYTRDTGDLEHIRYRHDYTGYHTFRRRLKRALNLKMLFGSDSISRALGFGWTPSRALTWIQVSLRKEKNLPDGIIKGGSVITFWEEDGEYIETVGPTIGEKVADFLEQDPENPHAQSIAAEIRRVWALSTEKEES